MLSKASTSAQALCIQEDYCCLYVSYLLILRKMIFLHTSGSGFQSLIKAAVLLGLERLWQQTSASKFKLLPRAAAPWWQNYWQVTTQDIKRITREKKVLENKQSPEKSCSFPGTFSCFLHNCGNKHTPLLILAQSQGRFTRRNTIPSCLSTSEWKWWCTSAPRGILISPPLPIWSKCPKQPKFTSNSWNWATCVCFPKLSGGYMLGLPHCEPAGYMNLSTGMICSHCW